MLLSVAEYSVDERDFVLFDSLFCMKFFVLLANS